MTGAVEQKVEEKWRTLSLRVSGVPLDYVAMTLFQRVNPEVSQEQEFKQVVALVSSTMHQHGQSDEGPQTASFDLRIIEGDGRIAHETLAVSATADWENILLETGRELYVQRGWKTQPY